MRMPNCGSHSPPAELVVALANNMPSGASRATERQFADLLTTASQTVGIPIRLFVVDTLLSDSQNTLHALGKARPDGLIVTGTEPRSMTVTDEPLWPALAQLVDWAADHTLSTIWSCLAAHAAVFRLDEISRKRLPRKLSGVFTCTRAADHPLLADAPLGWAVPHSRCNTLDEVTLRNKGYTILSHAPRVGADSFVKQVRASLFLLLQGHLEYGPDALLGEFRRDVKRFLIAQRDQYPDVPENYFDPDVARVLARLREQACRTPGLDVLAALDASITVVPRQVWHAPAKRLYARWLSYLREQKVAQANAVMRPTGQWRIAS